MNANQVTIAEDRIRALEHVARCSEEFAKAMIARDAIENCSSLEWRLAHAAARTAAVAKSNALSHAYAIGAMSRPVWP